MEEGNFVKVFDYDDLQTLSLTHWGPGGSKIRLPNDSAVHGAMNGPCRTYHLGKPMKLQELEAMPRDLQLAYLRKLRRLGASWRGVGDMLGLSPAQLHARWNVCFDMPNPTAWAAFLGQC